MKLLLINSSDKNAFAAIVNETKQAFVYASEFNEAESIPGKTPDKLIHCLDKLSAKSDIKDIDAVAVTIGPGSFTGIRVGIALAKGIALGLDKKIIPVDNFELTLGRLHDIQSDKTYCVLLEAKLPEYYYAVFENDKIIKKGSDTLENLAKTLGNDTIIVGDFGDETELKHCYFSVLNVKDRVSEFDTMLIITQRKFISANLSDAKDVQPLYLKDFNFRKP